MRPRPCSTGWPGWPSATGNGVYWQSGVATFMGSEGQTGSIETTALAALAFLRADTHPDLANAALTYLIQQKDSFGTWYSTQATVLSLKALHPERARRRARMPTRR